MSLRKSLNIYASIAALGLSLAGCSIVEGTLFPLPEAPAREGGPLRLNGYYYAVEENPEGTGTLIRPILLWSDGTAAYFSAGVAQFAEGDDSDYAPPQYGTEQEAHAVFAERLRDLDRGPSGATDWGAFRVRGDSITVQAVVNFDRLTPSSVVEYKGIVLSDTSFALPTYPSGSTRPLEFRTYYFQPLSDKPPSSNWTHERLRVTASRSGS
jgi:hypothetical protein